jgi:uncharacterized protein (UPF0276 family)
LWLSPSGVGLGLRWEFLPELAASAQRLPVDFLELAPENYLRRGGYYPALLERVGERYALTSHGLSLSIGSSEPPDAAYLTGIKQLLARWRCPWHSDHLSFSNAQGNMLHELLPLELSAANARRVAERVVSVQDALGVRFALENISFYARLGRADLDEAEFISDVLERSGASLVLDLNNAFVNACNHGGDARAFVAALPHQRVVEIHVAGHEQRPRKNGGHWLVDTHGARVSDEVLELLAWTLARTGPVPVLLERDHDVPALPALLEELAEVRAVYDAVCGTANGGRRAA